MPEIVTSGWDAVLGKKFSVDLLALESPEQKRAGPGWMPALEQGGNIRLSRPQRSGRQQISQKADEDRERSWGGQIEEHPNTSAHVCLGFTLPPGCCNCSVQSNL